MSVSRSFVSEIYCVLFIRQLRNQERLMPLIPKVFVVLNWFSSSENIHCTVKKKKLKKPIIRMLDTVKYFNITLCNITQFLFTFLYGLILVYYVSKVLLCFGVNIIFYYSKKWSEISPLTIADFVLEFIIEFRNMWSVAVALYLVTRVVALITGTIPQPNIQFKKVALTFFIDFKI